MPSVFTVHDAAKVRLFAPLETLDAYTPPAATMAGRIAPNELVVVGDPSQAAAIVAHAEQALALLGTRAMVIDHTDGWSLFSLTGDDIEQVFARVSMLGLPDAADEPVFFMGRIAHVASKAFRRAGRIDIMTGSETTRHVADTLAHAGHHAGLTHVSAPETDPLGVTS